MGSKEDEPFEGFHHVPLVGVVMFVDGPGGSDSLFFFLVNPMPSPIVKEITTIAAKLLAIIHLLRRTFRVPV